MRILMLGVLVAVAACSQEAQAPATDSPAADTPQAAASPAFVGSYAFAADNLTAAGCDLVLEPDPVEGSPGIYRVTLGEALITTGESRTVSCVEAYPILSTLTGWQATENEGIRLLGAQGESIAEFSPAGTIFQALPSSDGATYLLTPEETLNNPQ
jgi:hypothetical protein